MTSFRRRLLVAATAVVAFVPAVAFAQLSAIKGGVDAAAGAAQLRTASCTGAACATRIIGQVINVAVGFSGVVLFGLFIYAGFLWMTAQTGKDVETAQGIIKNAVMGLLLIGASYAIAAFVLSQLSTVVNGSGSTTAGTTVDTTTPGSADTTGAGTAPTTSGGSTAPPTATVYICSCLCRDSATFDRASASCGTCDGTCNGECIAGGHPTGGSSSSCH